MALIALPTGAEFERLDWRPNPTVQVNRSPWNNRRRVLDLDNGYFSATVEIFANTETMVRLWRSFYAKLRGPANTFPLPVGDCDQHSGAVPNVSSGGAAGAASVVLSAAPALVEGHYATIPLTGGSKQIVLLTADISTNTITFDPPLRLAAASGAAVETKRPYGIVALSPDTPPPQDADGIWTWAFQVDEAF